MPTAPQYSDHISQLVANHRYSNGPGGEEIVEMWKAYGLIPYSSAQPAPARATNLTSSDLYTDATGGNTQGGYPFSGVPVDPSLGIANGTLDVSPSASISDVLTQACEKWGIYRGLQHPLYTDLYLDEFTAVPIGGSVSQANIVGTFRTIGLPSGNEQFGPRRWLVSFKTSSTVMNTKTNFGWYVPFGGGAKQFGLITVGYYSNNTVNPAADQPSPSLFVSGQLPTPANQNQFQYQYCEMDGLETIVTWEWVYNQISFATSGNDPLKTVAGIVNTYNGVLSNTAMFPLAIPLVGGSAGCDPYTVRTRVIASTVTPRRNMQIPDPDTGLLMYLQQVKYILEYRKRGWRQVETFKYPQTGFEPLDVAQPGLHIPDPTNHPAVFKTPNAAVNPDDNSGNGWILTQPIQDMDLTVLDLADPGSF